jgi:diketogulonate reductase-like aldo/keto reductase
MERRPFGPLKAEVSIIGQGSWHIARGDRARAITALRRGLDLGMNHIDTAEMYDGAEALIGEAIKGRRDEAFIVSKVLPSNASKERTRRACEKSLARLKTGRLDCYLLHWRGEHPLAETFEAFAALKQEGKILSYGVSNFDAEDLREALAITGKDKIVCNQVLYHLQERAIEHEVIPFCEKNGIAEVAYSPIGQDSFPAPNSAGGKVLGEIALSHRTSPRQVALAFLTRQNVVFAIPKAGSPEHAEDNAAAGKLKLGDDEIAKIDRAFPRGSKPRSLPML